jgi:hypothetical protein
VEDGTLIVSTFGSVKVRGASVGSQEDFRVIDEVSLAEIGSSNTGGTSATRTEGEYDETAEMRTGLPSVASPWRGADLEN